MFLNESLIWGELLWKSVVWKYGYAFIDGFRKKTFRTYSKVPNSKKIEFTILDRAHLLDWVNEFIHKNE